MKFWDINYVGPDEIFSFYGYTEIAVRLRVNSVYLEVTGYKYVEFPDGTKIKFNNIQDVFQNTLMGVCHHILYGKMVFEDDKNQLTGIMDIGEDRYKPKDCLTGHIEHNGKKVCEKIEGTYMGYTDFEGQRYFDVRHMNILEQEDLPLESKDPLCLDSDSRRRCDLSELLNGNVDVAQSNKHLLEVDQRRDRKLREKAAARRKNGGPKIVYPD